MNLNKLVLGALVGSSLIAVGCDDKTPAPAAAPASADLSAPPTAMDKARDQAQSTVDAAQAKMAATGDQASAAGDSMVAQAQKLYDQATAAVGKADFSGAQKYLDELTSMKSKLPADWQAKVDQLAKMVADGKSKLGGMSVPSMPK